ncbi:MAG TPA: thioredoxin fold domain-containing protein [Spirochaetota bacterium]|nr:thioredoxin fold domain-containing protein [Spirochaetota bacterium]HPF05350.1 thioredoxin fold domain-containing protein [Spirochaetota bacterium]HPJ41780.1 thioredoxin fold domain-containing protein [Spirochaetota bacterium]HRX46980.1 thioredoxin fold domain-containing protein [Spirochaetota bacterium]
MKSGFLKIIILNLIFIVFSCSNSSTHGEKNSVQMPVKWYGITEGMNKAEKEGKSIIMYFYTDWCVYCKKMESQIFSDPDISAFMNEKYVSIRINPERDRETIAVMGQNLTPSQFMGQIGASGFPTTMFWDKKQKPLTVLPGYTEKETFLSVISYIDDECYSKNIPLDNYIKDKSACGKK